MLLLAGSLGLAACDRHDSDTMPTAAGKGAAARNEQRGRIVDLASVLSAKEKNELAQRLAHEQQVGGRPVMVVVLETGKEQSLEQVGWAVGGGAASNRPFLLLIDPAARRVRIEGDLPPERKAEVAAAMQADLSAGRLAAAINLGLSRLQQVAP